MKKLLIFFLITTCLICNGQSGVKFSKFILPKGYYILDSTNFNFNSINFKVIALEKNINKNKDAEHNSNNIIVLKQKDNVFYEICRNTKVVFEDDSNCPIDGLNDLVSKNNYFTIEQTICSDFMFVNSYSTFKIDNITNEILLHKYGQKYSDRSNPDKKIPDKIWSVKDFGNIKFQDFNKRFMINLIQNNPKN